MPNITNDDRDYINDLLVLEENDIYSLIPSQLPKYTTTQFNEEGQVQAGKNEFNKREAGIRDALCNKWKACDKIKDEKSKDKIDLIAAIGDVVSAASLGIPPFIIAALIVRVGIRKFCNCAIDE